MVLYRCDCCGKETIKSDLVNVNYKYHGPVADFGIDSGDICTSCAGNFSKELFKFKCDFFGKCLNNIKGG